MEVTVPVPGTASFALLGATEKRLTSVATRWLGSGLGLGWFGLVWFGLVSYVVLAARQALSPLLKGPFFFS